MGIKKKIKNLFYDPEHEFNELYRKYGVPKEIKEALKDDKPDLSRRDKFITVIVPMIIITAIAWLLTRDLIGSCLFGLFIGGGIGSAGIYARRNELVRKKEMEMKNQEEPQKKNLSGIR